MNARRRTILVFVLIAMGAASASALECRNQRFRDASFAVCWIDLPSDDLRLYWQDSSGRPYSSFANVGRHLEHNEELLWATNAGIFSPEKRPLGWHVEDGRTRIPVNRDSGDGNFFLQPNGAFVVSGGRARILKTDEIDPDAPGIRLAVQSGPLLLARGAISPLFRAGSMNRLIRSGVGVRDGRAVFVISEDPVSFFDFARLFRDGLGCGDALYLDGVISKFYCPSIGRRDAGDGFAGILAVVGKKSR